MTPQKTTTSQRRGRPGYDREALLEVCVAEFIKHGYHATSIGILAEALGVSKSAIYHHVDSKEQLLEMAVERALGALEGTITEAEAQAGTSLDRVEWLLEHSVHLLVTERPYVTLLLRLRGNTEVELAAMARRRAATKRIEALVRTAQQDGLIRPDLGAKATTRLMLGMVNSIVDWYQLDGTADVDELVHNVRTIAMDGFRARP
ncbi:TetR family transcriptional regulator [Luteococcus japonicus]|uniref:Transcriptional regulator, TetR family n=2 Tax=Luteococcus japonicus TaxID=33984 RepID=A0A1R4KA95_9ACTN|nr:MULTISPECIES: TetR/AcrR family transcriptional regulator [Luteococcus]MDN5564459.1 TetR/AcrR family transcriptional regulator [Luteococcus sp.]ROR54445.1 TetR family transcriptional regulator [Luteococcus japonicus]SJN40943.1 Transcriptional regulator, TetR family [Luteococcus japonicus LSP_Lj1]